MKPFVFLSIPVVFSFITSCANKGADNQYDVSNPYSAPEYAEQTPVPSLPSDLNPAYDAPAVYEETSSPEPAPIPPTLTSPTIRPSIKAPVKPLAKPTLRPAAPRTKVHSVIRGDSLWEISKKYKVSIEAIKKANGMKSDTIVIGSKLQIPAS